MKKYLYRGIIYIIGIFFLAFSVAFAVNSDLGISPVNSFPNAISIVSGVSLGTCASAVFIFYVLLQIVILRKKFKWYNIFQIVVSLMFGYFTDFAKKTLGSFCFPTYAGRLLMLGISIVLIAIGISLYTDVKLIPMPSEGLTLTFSEAFGIKFHNMKIIQDCVSVSLAIIISLVFTGKILGVREGTLISALLVGKLIGLLQKKIKPAIEKICF